MTRSRHLTATAVLAVIALSTLARGCARIQRRGSAHGGGDRPDEAGARLVRLDEGAGGGGQTKIVAAQDRADQVVDEAAGGGGGRPAGVRRDGVHAHPARRVHGHPADRAVRHDNRPSCRPRSRRTSRSARPRSATRSSRPPRTSARGHRTIVLVSDGEATCAPDPCVVARRSPSTASTCRSTWSASGSAGRPASQLQCVAREGRGDYYDADSADDLVRALDRLVDAGASSVPGDRRAGSMAATRRPRRLRSRRPVPSTPSAGGVGTREVVRHRAADPGSSSPGEAWPARPRRAPTGSSSSTFAGRLGGGRRVRHRRPGTTPDRRRHAVRDRSRGGSARFQLRSTPPAPTTTCSFSCGGGEGRARLCRSTSSFSLTEEPPVTSTTGCRRG